MLDTPLLRRILTSLVILGTVAVTALWLAAITAQCEGFGCLGVGAMVGMAVLVHLVTAMLASILIWLASRVRGQTTWIWAILAVHVPPLLWYGVRFLLH